MDAEEGARGGAPSTSAMYPDGTGPAADLPVFSTVLVYATSARVYVVAGTSDKSRWRILNVSRALNADDSLDASEDPGEYDEAQCARVLATIAAGNASSGGMILVARGRALVGTLRILDAHYLLLITERERLGRVRGHDVFGVGGTELVRVAMKDSTDHGAMRTLSTSSSPASGDEKKLKKLLAWVDLSRGCFYSHTYGLTATLQSNVLDVDAASRARRDFDSPFAWNAHVSRPLRAALGGAAAARWLVPLVHGFFERRRVSLLGRRLEIALVARRSRHFAGTRYRRRGVNARGAVANEVETEQIVDASRSLTSLTSRAPRRLPARGVFDVAVSSAAQMRGSIPVFWSQEASVVAARPEIVLAAGNGAVATGEAPCERGGRRGASAAAYAATARHFDLCEARYGAPVVALSLIRSNERRRREATLRDALCEALETLNEARLEAGRERVACVHWDFAEHVRRGVARTAGETRDAKGKETPDARTRRTTEASTEASTDASSARAPPRKPRETSTTLGLTRLARVAAGALELVGVFAVGPRVALEAAAARREREQNARGGPTARAAEAWRAAECELVTGLADGRPGEAGASASPWAVSFAAAPNFDEPNSDESTDSSPRDARARARDDRVRDGSNVANVGVATQRGVLRSHCVDCLDRTNVAQFAWGLAALGAQLEALGLADGEAIPLDGSFAGELLEMYRAMGDALAVQYGGSEAHAKADMRRGGVGGCGDETAGAAFRSARGVGAFARRVREAATSSSAKMLVSARRFYSNAYTDADKQEGIDMFLGAHPATAFAFEDEESDVSVSRDLSVASGSRANGADEATNARDQNKPVSSPPSASSLNWALLRGGASRGAWSRDASDDDSDYEYDALDQPRRLDAKKKRSGDDGWVSLRAVAARSRARPVRLDGDCSVPRSGRERQSLEPSRLSREPEAIPGLAEPDDDFLVRRAFHSSALSEEDARTYAAFAAEDVFAEDVSPAVTSTTRSEDDAGHREWSETAAAAEYAAIEAATRA